MSIVTKKKSEEEVTDQIKPEDPKTTDRISLVTELDSYISDTIQSQPKTVPETVTIETERYGEHRLSLPEPFEKYSHECTRGLKCKYHKWTFVKESIGKNRKDQEILVEKWSYKKIGKYTFRWIFKHKRSIDYARSVVGWSFVNRTNFPDVPSSYFSLNGAVELGDNILAFMHYKAAEQLRESPGQKSRERLGYELTKHKNNDKFYEAKLDPERTEGDDYAPTGALQEGRDF